MKTDFRDLKRKDIEQALKDRNLEFWLDTLKNVRILENEEKYRPVLTALDSRFERLFKDEEVWEFLKAHELYQKAVILKYNNKREKKILKSSDLMKIATSIFVLPRVFEINQKEIDFLNFIESFNVKKDTINSFLKNTPEEINSSEEQLHIYRVKGEEIYEFAEGGTHRAYISLLFAPLVKLRTGIRYVDIEESQDFYEVYEIAKSYYELRHSFKKKGLEVKIRYRIAYINEENKQMKIYTLHNSIPEIIDFLLKHVNVIKSKLLINKLSFGFLKKEGNIEGNRFDVF